jgi:DNA-binding LacI/PurR family transcriptional regulator
LGIRSIRLFPPVFVQKLLDHLAEKGHREIDCLNTECAPGNAMEQRIEQWQLWRMTHGVKGRLINDPDGSPMNSYRTLLPILKRGEFQATALFCTTIAAAVGALRAFHECGYQVGRDVAVCTVNGEGMAQYLVPSVTCLELQDLRPYLRVALEWMSSDRQDWVGSLLVQPPDVELFLGESTAGEAPTADKAQASGATG